MSQLGDTIKRRRLAMGQSRGQLAHTLGTTATVVAGYERGERIPDEAALGKLAAVFGVQEYELTGDAPPPQPDGGDATALVTAPVAPRPEPLKAPVAVAEPAPEPEPVFDEVGMIPVVAAEAAVRPTRTAATATNSVPARPAELIDAPTEAVPVVEQPPVAVVPAPAATPVTYEEPTTGLYASYRRFLAQLFDRDKPYLFWLRFALTVVMLLVGLRVLSWAVPALFDALGDILSTIESTNPTATTIPGT